LFVALGDIFASGALSRLLTSEEACLRIRQLASDMVPISLGALGIFAVDGVVIECLG